MNDGRPHFGEPNLDALIRRVVESGKLRGSTELESADAADPRSAGDQRRKTRIRLRQSSHLFGSPKHPVGLSYKRDVDDVEIVHRLAEEKVGTLLNVEPHISARSIC